MWSPVRLIVRVPVCAPVTLQPVAACKGRVAELASGFLQALWQQDLSSRFQGTARASVGGAPT